MSNVPTTTLRPGLLVSFKTTLTGGVKYDKRMLESEYTTEGGAQLARWETERTIADPKEHRLGYVARGKARQIITRVCAWSAFGLLCPETNIGEFEKAVAEARKVADDFNAKATVSRLNVYVLTGRIAANDIEAARAINADIRSMMDAMQAGIKNMDATAIRKVASKARAIGQMLSPEAESRLKVAIEAARGAAKQIVKAGENAAIEVDKIALRRIKESRTAFLDLDEQAEVQKAKPKSRAVDLAPAEAAVALAPAKPKKRAARDIDINA